jgi:rhodanese-related sulfurtransferase
VTYTQILYPGLRELLAEADTQLVEVLPPAEYEELHIPGAISIPLKTLDEQTTAGLDKTKAVVVYCWDGI